MEEEIKKTIIEYSGFILLEQCYEYNEDACYLSESKDSALQFMIDFGYTKSQFRIDEINIQHIIDDYGCSSGEFAMSEIVFERFKEAVAIFNLEYTCKDWYMDPSLKVVNI